MIPLKPRPKAAATANKPASSWVSRKPVIVTIWHAEPAITVRNPPTRSAINPQSCRPMNPKASSTDNIALPRVTGMPRSLQKTGTQDQYFVALQLGARAPRQDGAVANGLAAFGGGLPPSRATREQDAAGAGALNCFHHHVAQDRGMPSGLFEARVYHLGTGRSTRLRRHRDAK